MFTLFSLELSQFGTQLAPLWFPTSIMMVAFYRHAGRMWPGIALSCSLGNIAASILLFSTSSLNMTWTTINIVEAVVGAVLLRKLLPWYNPLQNLADWLRLALAAPLFRLCWGAFCCPADARRRSSQGIFDMGTVRMIGALALVPLGLLFKPHYLLRHRNPRLLFESLLTLPSHLR
ncbi:MASE1 domain-containing protein [Escherichia coli]